MSKFTVPGNVVLTKKADRELVARKLAERLAYKQRDIRGDIENWSEFLRKKAAELANVEAAVEQETARFAEAVAKLRAAGVKFTPTWGLNIEVATTKKGLGKVYKAIGRLDGAKQGKEIHDAGKKLVKVTLPAVAYPFVSVSFVHKLTETDRCRIETETVTRTRLVCKRD